MNEKTRKWPFLVLALLPFVFLACEFIVVLIDLLIYGTSDYAEISKIGIYPMLIHWFLTVIIWGIGLWFSYKISKKLGFNPFEYKDKPSLKNLIIVGILIIIVTTLSYIMWEMRFKPIVELNGMINRYGNQGIITFIGQYIYYIVESGLFTAIIVFGQHFGEKVFKKTNIPWGGILCALTWGLGHIITQNSITGISTFIVSIIFGITYLLLRKNVKYTYIILTIMFMI
jgi:hypothetical protein